MRKTFLLTLFVFSSLLAYAQRTANFKLLNFNLNGSEFSFEIWAQRTGGTSIIVGNTDFVINYNNSGLSNPVLSNINANYTGALGTDDYDPMTVSTPQAGKLSVSITFTGNNSGIGNALSTTAPDGERIATVTLDVDDAGQNAGISWDDANTAMVTMAFQTVTSTNTGSSNTPLPVSLTGFHALVEGNSAKTTWTTASEINNRGFYLERSVDAANWEVVSFIPSLAPAGNSHHVLNYTYTDQNVYQPWTGVDVYYYRLRQQDYNGTEEYVGGVQAVRFGGVAVAENSIEVYPTPATDVLNFKATPGTEFSVVLYDINGRAVAEQQFEGQLQLNVTTISAGPYHAVVSTQDGTIVDSRKVLIAR